MINYPRRLQFSFTVVILALLAVRNAAAINIDLDYTYDSTNFFGSGNPDGSAAGAQAKLALEAAADFYSGILTDTFSKIETPAPFNSSVMTGMVTWSWSLSFNNPTTGSLTTLVDQTIEADDYRIYVGARNLPGNTVGLGGPGGFSPPTIDIMDNNFTNAEIGQINQISADFSDAIGTRGETSGFSRWGGAVTFDNEPDRDWHYDHTVLPSFILDSDFFSIAIHEIGHALGLGASDNWNNWVNGTNYTGPSAVSEFGGVVPLECNMEGCGHWANGTNSVILGTTTAQETAMHPILTTGTRKRLTALDAAALEDIGWNVSTPSFATADYNTDGDVDAGDLATLENWYSTNANGDADGDGDTDGADFLIWQRQFTGPQPSIANVPEPGSAWLLASGLIAVGVRRQ